MPVPTRRPHDEPDADEVFRVKATASVQDLASAIAMSLYEGRRVVLRAIGAGALNQAVKSMIIAQGFVAPKGYTLYARPSFSTLTTPQGEVSAISLAVYALD